MHVTVRRPRPRVLRTLGVDVVGALNLVGALIKYLSAAFLFPAAVAAAYGEAVWPFLAGGLATAAFGMALEAVTDGREAIGPREGYLVISLLWLLVGVFGAVPYVLAEPQLARPVDAFFESIDRKSTRLNSSHANIS